MRVRLLVHESRDRKCLPAGQMHSTAYTAHSADLSASVLGPSECRT